MPNPSEGISVARMEKTIILLLMLLKINPARLLRTMLYEVQPAVYPGNYSFDNPATTGPR